MNCETLSIAGTSQSAFIAKFNSSGSVIWISDIEYYATFNPASVTTDSNDNIYITGSINTTHSIINTETKRADLTSYSDAGIALSDVTSGSDDVFVTQFNSDGELQWFKSATNTGTAKGNDIQIDSDDNIYITGYYDGTINGVNTSTDKDAFIAKYSSSGTLTWLKSYGDTGDENGESITADHLNNFYIVADNTIVKYDSDGTEKWSISSSSTDGVLSVTSITTDNDGDLFISGHFNDDADFNGIGLTTTPDYVFNIFTTMLSNSDDLPIELVTFSGEIKDDYVLLEWETATEINNDFFTIERSSDKRSWKEIHKIEGGGNSSIHLKYSIKDNEPLNGKGYYRLKQTDFDGQFSYSDIITIDFNGDRLEQFRFFPNPTQNSLTLFHDYTHDIKYQIFNSQGTKILDGIINSRVEKN